MVSKWDDSIVTLLKNGVQVRVRVRIIFYVYVLYVCVCVCVCTMYIVCIYVRGIYPVPRVNKKDNCKCESAVDQTKPNQNSLVDTNAHTTIYTHTQTHSTHIRIFYLSRFMAYNKTYASIKFYGNKRWGENVQTLGQAHTHNNLKEYGKITAL